MRKFPRDTLSLVGLAFIALVGGVVVAVGNVSLGDSVGGANRSSNGQIVFPNPEYYTSANNEGGGVGWGRLKNTQEKSQKGLPLHILRELGSGEKDFAQVVKQLVANARVERNSATGEEFLVDSNGSALLDERGKKIYIGGDNGVVQKTKITTLALPNNEATAPKSNSSAPSSKMPFSPRMGAKPVSIGIADKGWSSALCKPEEQTVSLSANFEPHIVYYPRCVRVERCGGCCSTDILACEPPEGSLTTVDVPVQKYEYVAEKLIFIQQEYISVERHTKCECGCRIKSKDCNALQVYSDQECLCVCANTIEQEACFNNQLKVWHPRHCTCSCREIRDCNSGFYFNLESCECLRLSPLKASRVGRKTQNQGNVTYNYSHRRSRH